MTVLSKKMFQAKKLIKKHMYLTQDCGHLFRHICSRISKYGKGGNLHDKWADAQIKFEVNACGETILKICGLEVMSDFETPYMKALAGVVAKQGGDVLNVGFGLGLLDGFIEELRDSCGIREHYVIEYNKQVYELALKWRGSLSSRDHIHIFLGDWREALPVLKQRKKVFDGIVYDAFPLDANEICRDSVEFLKSVLQQKMLRLKTGVLTFYVDSPDGLSKKFMRFLRSLGVGHVEIKQVGVRLPEREIEYWNKPFFLVPILSDMRYAKV